MLESRNQYLSVFSLFLAFLFAATLSRGEEPYATESFAAKASAHLPADIVNGLDPQGSRLTTSVNGVKITVCELWWAKSLATQSGSPAAHGILYGNLRVGTLLGAIHYLAESNEDYREDFRDQKLRPGYYTMRYVQMPEDREHKNVNPYRDFVLLSPVSVDRDPGKVPAMDEMLRWSRLASRSRHPAILSLAPVDTAHKHFPEVITDDAGSCILQVKLHLTQEKTGAPQDVALAIILVTPRKENGES
jgi:hypothetical protein